MRVVVVGATGNVGTSVMRALVDEPTITSIVGVARRVPRADGSSTVHPPHDAASWVRADVTDTGTAPAALDEALAGADAVIHLVWAVQPARDEAALRRVNVDGARAVVDAVVRNKVPHLVVVSSVGAYSPGPDDGSLVDEDWPTAGVPTSAYATHKAQVERILDATEAAEEWLTVSRVRPTIMLQAEAGAEVAGYFLGGLGTLGVRLAAGGPGRVLGGLLRGWRSQPEPDEPPLLPLLPFPAGVRLQVLHPDDTAAAVRSIVVGRHPGAFNLAPEGWLTGQDVADILAGGRLVQVSPRLVRNALVAASAARLVPIDVGWFDMANADVMMDAARAREILRWAPSRTQAEVLIEGFRGVVEGTSGSTPPLTR